MRRLFAVTVTLLIVLLAVPSISTATTPPLFSGNTLPSVHVEQSAVGILAPAYAIADSFQFPLSGYMITGYTFGQQVGTMPDGSPRYHLGEDAGQPAGTPVYAIANGYVKLIYTNANSCAQGDYGTAVVIEHQLPTGDQSGNYITSIYGHLRSTDLQVGYGSITKGQLIGYLGNYYQNGCFPEHLHLGMRKGMYDGTISGYGNGSTLATYLNPSRPLSTVIKLALAPLPLMATHVTAQLRTRRTVNLTWNAPSSCPGLDVYTVRVTDDPSKIDTGPWLPGHDGGVDAPTTTKTETFDRDGDFYWAVWPCRGCKAGNTVGLLHSDVYHFRIDTGTGGSDGIQICDGTNYDKPCDIFHAGEWPDLSTVGWYDRIESVRFRGNYVGHYRVLLREEVGGSAGNPINTGTDLSTLGSSNNRMRYLKIYYEDPNPVPQPPTLQSPDNGATYNEGDSIHVSWSAQAMNTMARSRAG